MTELTGKKKGGGVASNIDLYMSILQFTLKAQSDSNARTLSDYHLESLIDSGEAGFG